MLRRFRLLLPPDWFVFVVVFGALTISIVEILVDRNFLPAPGFKKQVSGRIALCLLLAIGYGIWRVVSFHPFCLPDYRKWLESTPWTREKPPPLGPIHLVWEDAAIVGMLWLPFFTQKNVPPLVLPIVFLASYLIALAPGLILTESWASGYAVLYGFGAIVFLHKHLMLMALAMLGYYAIARYGLWTSLGRFPWSADVVKRLKIYQLDDTQIETDRRFLGWPFDSLGPKAADSEFSVTPRHAILCSFLIGWWVASFASQIPVSLDRNAFVVAVSVFGSLIAMVSRLLIFINGVEEPLTLWGRIRTCRWIIPGFDKVFVAPCLTLLCGCAIPYDLVRLDVPYVAAFPIGLSLALTCAFLVGPSLRNWRLTGTHRIVPRAFSTANKSINVVKLG